MQQHTNLILSQQTMPLRQWEFVTLRLVQGQETAQTNGQYSTDSIGQCQTPLQTSGQFLAGDQGQGVCQANQQGTYVQSGPNLGQYGQLIYFQPDQQQVVGQYQPGYANPKGNYFLAAGSSDSFWTISRWAMIATISAPLLW